MVDLRDTEHGSTGRDGNKGAGLHSFNATHTGRLINTRGTEDGLVIRVDGRADWADILNEIRIFLSERRTFLKGGAVALEWLDRLPTKEQSKELELLLKETYGVEVVGKRKRESFIRLVDLHRDDLGDAGQIDSEGDTTDTIIGKMVSSKTVKSILEQGEINPGNGSKAGNETNNGAVLTIDNKTGQPTSTRSYIDRMAQMLGEDIFYDDDANAKIVFGTLRSGQRVETPFSLIVIGDVNPGADLVAGGDIIVFGTLRGTAHASAYEDDCSDRVIVALKMQPMQLRIGSVISRGNDDNSKGPEVARIEDRRVIVETYNPRATLGRRKQQ